MKAIEILENYKHDLLKGNRKLRLSPEIEELDEAIAELQDLESYLENDVVPFKTGVDPHSFCGGYNQARKDILTKLRGEK
jgi:hypothetical protein